MQNKEMHIKHLFNLLLLVLNWTFTNRSYTISKAVLLAAQGLFQKESYDKS